MHQAVIRPVVFMSAAPLVPCALKLVMATVAPLLWAAAVVPPRALVTVNVVPATLVTCMVSVSTLTKNGAAGKPVADATGIVVSATATAADNVVLAVPY